MGGVLGWSEWGEELHVGHRPHNKPRLDTTIDFVARFCDQIHPLGLDIAPAVSRRGRKEHPHAATLLYLCVSLVARQTGAHCSVARTETLLKPCM